MANPINISKPNTSLPPFDAGARLLEAVLRLSGMDHLEGDPVVASTGTPASQERDMMVLLLIRKFAWDELAQAVLRAGLGSMTYEQCDALPRAIFFRQRDAGVADTAERAVPPIEWRLRDGDPG